VIGITEWKREKGHLSYSEGKRAVPDQVGNRNAWTKIGLFEPKAFFFFEALGTMEEIGVKAGLQTRVVLPLSSSSK
jgi:hypothetical protein